VRLPALVLVRAEHPLRRPAPEQGRYLRPAHAVDDQLDRARVAVARAGGRRAGPRDAVGEVRDRELEEREVLPGLPRVSDPERLVEDAGAAGDGDEVPEQAQRRLQDGGGGRGERDVTAAPLPFASSSSAGVATAAAAAGRRASVTSAGSAVSCVTGVSRSVPTSVQPDWTATSVTELEYCVERLRAESTVRFATTSGIGLSLGGLVGLDEEPFAYHSSSEFAVSRTTSNFVPGLAPSPAPGRSTSNGSPAFR
jgi:hypothetical protein